MACYYCNQPFADKDLAVELKLHTMETQENGGVLATENETVWVHQSCLGAP